MKTLTLLRHSLTEANERRQYCGASDLPLSEQGRAIAASLHGRVPPCDRCCTSGMRRANETLSLMTGRAPDAVLNDLREMDFGAFELHTYDELKDNPDYIRWIEDQTGEVACPGGECASGFRRRVVTAGDALLTLPVESVCAVCHGGVIVRLMEHWFPDSGKNYYDWQPGPCGGYRIDVENGRPAGFEEVFK